MGKVCPAVIVGPQGSRQGPKVRLALCNVFICDSINSSQQFYSIKNTRWHGVSRMVASGSSVNLLVHVTTCISTPECFWPANAWANIRNPVSHAKDPCILVGLQARGAGRPEYKRVHMPTGIPCLHIHPHAGRPMEYTHTPRRQQLTTIMTAHAALPRVITRDYPKEETINKRKILGIRRL